MNFKHSLIALSIVGLSTQSWAARHLAEESGSTADNETNCSSSRRITFLHINDQHARVQPASTTAGVCSDTDTEFANCFGGWARISTAVKQEMGSEANGDVIFLDGGDQFTGTLWDYYYQGSVTPDFSNAVGVEAQAVGNHDWDYGPDVLANYSLALSAPLLSCNVDASLHPVLSQTLRKYTVRTLADGYRVGVIGLTPPDAETTSSPGPLISIEDPFAALPGCVAELMAEEGGKGVQAVVVLSHAGYDVDQKLAAQVSGIDLIIGAHTHTFLYDGTPPELLVDANTTDTPMGSYPTVVDSETTPGKKVPVVQAFWASRYLGKLVTEWGCDDDGVGGGLLSWSGSPILLGGSNSSNPVERDPSIVAIEQLYWGPLQDMQKEVVGETLVKLEGEVAARLNETAFGDMVADAMLERLSSTGFLEQYTEKGMGVVAMVNSGTIRTSLEMGQITVADAVGVFPYGNAMLALEVTGQQVLDCLENSVKGYPQNEGDKTPGAFVQLSGMRYSFNPAGEAGARVVATEVMEEGGAGAAAPVDPLAKYVLVATDYMYSGGDGFTSLAGSPVLFPSSVTLDVVLMDYLQAHSPVDPQLQGRIVSCAAEPGNELCA